MIERIPLTLCMVVDEQKILLGFKKRGFGEGLWNGFGGKVHQKETVLEAVHRELFEEAGIKIGLAKECGRIEFTFDDSPGIVLEVHIYRGEQIIGTPSESEEMRPKWFGVDHIPYEHMWSDDVYWLPSLLEGKEFTGAFHFDVNRNITKHELTLKV